MAVDEIEIEDNPGGGEGAKIGGLAKKMIKKGAPSSSATSSRSTLTRFLGPSGPPSRALWEDINRQCPVCQRKGFSSRALALHVNECLDVGLREHDDGDGASAVREHARTRASGDIQEEITGAGSKPTAGASRAQKAAKVAKRDSVPARVLVNSDSQATSSDAAKVPPKILSKKPSKKAKTQAIQKPVHEPTTQKGAVSTQSLAQEIPLSHGFEL